MRHDLTQMGGRLFLAVPRWPVGADRHPEFCPHWGHHNYLSWWSNRALHALAERVGLVAENIEVLPPSPIAALIEIFGKVDADEFLQAGRAVALAREKER